MRNIIGKPVCGVDFFGRDGELQELKHISTEEHVLLLAPRRVGKTSLLCALASEVERDESATGTYVSVAASASEPQFVKTVLEAIYATKPGRRFMPHPVVTWLRRQGRRIRGVKLAGYGVDVEGHSAEWQEEADRAFSGLLKADRPWLLMVDELPTVILTLARHDPSGERVRGFLQWFRNLRQRPEAARKLRFIFSDVSLSLALARQLPDLEERGKTLRWLLEALVNDGYLVEQSERWRFRSGLLRRYWRKHVAP